MIRPLILVTNDDGIASRGLWSVVEALLPLGEIRVVAPDRQWSGSGRAMPHDVTGHLSPATRSVRGTEVTAWAVDASPALCVAHAILELLPRRPDLVVSGVNMGANLSIEVTISGTVGAALEASAFNVPALAVSLQMDSAYHLSSNPATSYAATQAYTAKFAEQVLTEGLPRFTDVLNINIPAVAVPETPWRYTRLSRHRYFTPQVPDRLNGKGRPGYSIIADPLETEEDSDIWAILVDHVVSVTPLTLDLTAPLPLEAAELCALPEPVVQQAQGV
ncbi:MAG: 5'/3'-nucleotidase SurE [Anaerolineales bacterium]